VRCLHDPRLIDELGKIDLAATVCPFVLAARDNDKLVIEKSFNIQVICCRHFGL
jgi:hypothetical protein